MTASRCPFGCGAASADTIDEPGRSWWACQSYQTHGHAPHQSRECEAYCEGLDVGRRRGHLEACREFALVHNVDGWDYSWMIDRVRRRLARKRRSE